MKNQKQWILSVFLLLGSILFTFTHAQSLGCLTKESQAQSRMPDYLHKESYTRSGALSPLNFCIRVYVHEIRNNSGATNVDPTIRDNQVSYLNSLFAGTGISFEWDDTTNIINSTTLYNRDYTFVSGGCEYVDIGLLDSDLDPYSHNDGIDLFFHGNISDYGLSNGIADQTEILFGYSTMNTNIIAHEMGHNLGLFHTRHSTIGDGSNFCENDDGFTHVPECANMTLSERDNSGDYVRDTEATKGDYTIDSFCNARDTGGAFDICGDNFNDPNGYNFMLDKYSSCRNTFSNYQIIRMKYFLAKLSGSPVPDLPMHETFTCTVVPGPCEDCNGAMGNSDQVFGTLSNTGCEYTLSFPLLTQNCSVTYIVEWNEGDGGTLNESGDTVTTTFNSEGVQTISITVIREGEACGTFNYLINVDETCEPPCPDCEETLNTIVSSFGQEPSIGCDSYSIDIPDLGECFKGRVDWGDLTTDPFVSNSTILHSYTSSGPRTVVLELFDDNGDLCASESIVIQVNCPSSCLNPCDIEADFSYSNDGCVYTFVAENTASDCAMDTWSYQWRIDGALVGTSEILVFDFETLFDYVGPHNVRLRIKYDPVGCRDIIKKGIQVNSCAGQRPLLNDDISIYPNPTRDAFKIESKNDVDIAQFTVRDIHGSIITSRRNNFTDEINISNNPVGIYFVEIKFNNGQSLIKKLILQK